AKFGDSKNIVSKVDGQVSAENAIIQSAREIEDYRQAEFLSGVSEKYLLNFLQSHLSAEALVTEDMKKIFNSIMKDQRFIAQLIHEKKLKPEHETSLLNLIDSVNKSRKALEGAWLPSREEARKTLQGLDLECIHADNQVKAAEQE